MTDFIEPVVGITAADDLHRQIHIDALNADNWIPSGYTPTNGGGLTLNVAAGRAFLGGAQAERDVLTPLTMIDASTNYVFVYIDDVLNDGVVYFHVDQDDTPPTEGPYHKLPEVTTSGGSITLITDKRRLIPLILSGLEIQGEAASVWRPLAADSAFATRVIGDNAFRFIQRADGRMDWGDGAGARDTNLYRDAASLLKTDDNLEANQLRTVVGKLMTDATRLQIRDFGDSLYKGVDVLNLYLGGVEFITSAGLVDGVDVSDHDARHEPGGADPMAVDAAIGTGSLRTLGDGALQAAPGDHSPSPLGESTGSSVATLELDLGAAVDDLWLFITIRGRSASAEAYLQINHVAVANYASAYSVNFATPTSRTNATSWSLSTATTNPEFFIVHIHKRVGVGEDGVGSWTGTRHGTDEAAVPSIINGGGLYDDIATAGLVGIDVGVLSGTADIVISGWGGVQ